MWSEQHLWLYLFLGKMKICGLKQTHSQSEEEDGIFSLLNLWLHIYTLCVCCCTVKHYLSTGTNNSVAS